MGTQKTNMGGGELPPDDQGPDNQEVVEETTNVDLGIPDNVRIDDDPTGFVPDAPVEELKGRKVRRMVPEDLEESHRRFAGDNVRITGERTSMPGAERPDQMPVDDSPLGKTSPNAQAEAQRLMPKAYRQQAAPQQEGQPAKGRPPARPRSVRPVADELSIGREEAHEAAATFEYLSEAERQARDEGDFGAAAQAKALSTRLQDEFNFERKSPQKQEHPALTKLLTNLGLKRIKRTSIPWGGSDWMFAATNAQLDYWVSRSMDSDGLNISALAISARLVGLDDVPLYEVLNIPLKKTFHVSVKEDEDRSEGHELSLVLYKKNCTCGNQIEVDAQDCDVCGATHDKFDMPLDLRVICAERFSQMLAEEFGAYESLPDLLKLQETKMKDRRLDAKELYPLVMPSSEEETTQD